MANSHGFVADGPERYGRALRSRYLPAIQAAVASEYHERLAAAGVVGRWLVRWRIRAEIDRRLVVTMEQDCTPEPSPYACW